MTDLPPTGGPSPDEVTDFARARLEALKDQRDVFEHAAVIYETESCEPLPPSEQPLFAQARAAAAAEDGDRFVYDGT